MARPNTADNNRYLDSNNRLSSAGAALSLKYARPQDLPSYPTSGLPPNHQKKQDATTAATLGWQNQKSYEPWKPEHSNAAAAAATRGWGTTAPKQWQPEQSMSGARAAVLAAQRNTNFPAQGVTAPPAPAAKPTPSAWGNTAANLAVSNSKAKRPGTATPPNTTYRPSDIDRHGSLMAATGAMAPRRRADSSPIVRPSYPDQANARTNALRAATQAESNSRSPKPVPVGGANPAVQMPRGKFGYNPGSQPQVDEKAHQEAMQSSAIAMAQQMYKIMEKNKNDKEATAGAAGALGRNRSLSLSSGSEATPPMRFNNLHDQAQKLAAQRLANMHDEEAQSREYREYYAGQLGVSPQQQQSGGSKRFSLGNMFGRNRRNSGDSLDDDVETRKIRAQMAVFSSSLSKVDTSKRQSDREHLLAIAQRNVQKDLQQIDQKVYAKTGKATPQLQSNWEQQAYAQQQAQIYAQQQHEQRMQNFGRIDIGGGTYMDQEQVDEMARRNVQPVLDDIDVHNKERIESEETKRLDAEEKKRQAVVDKQREKESKELEKNIKQQMKEEAKAKREEEKLSRRQSKSKRLSRFSSISRSTDAPAATSSPESSHVTDQAPVLAPLPAQQPISFTGQNASRDSVHDGTHHMSGAVRTSTTDTERAAQESMRSARGESSAVEPAVVPLPRHASDTSLAREANEDMRNEIPVENTEFDPHSGHSGAKTATVPIVPYAGDREGEEEEKIDAYAPVTIDPEQVAAPITIDATPAPAQNTTAYEKMPAATPPAQVLTKKNIDQKYKDAAAANAGYTAAGPNTAAGTSSPETGSPKEKKGVKGWLKKAFRRSSSGDEDKKVKKDKRNSKVVKDDPKGKRPIISDPVNNNAAADAPPAETTYIGLGAQGMGKQEGDLTQAQASQHGAGGAGAMSGGDGIAATSGPLDSHPDVHAVDRTLYDATPPAPGDQREAAIAYERQQERTDQELAVSDIDSELNARTHGKNPEQDASTVSMLSEGSMERKRRQELEEEQGEHKEKVVAVGNGKGGLLKVNSEREMERAAEREEERDGLGDVSSPKFPAERSQSPARETRFHEDV